MGLGALFEKAVDSEDAPPGLDRAYEETVEKRREWEALQSYADHDR